MDATFQACASLSATADAIIARNDAKARAFLSQHGTTAEAVMLGALKRSADFPNPSTGAALFIRETFPQPSMARGCVRSLIFRRLGLAL